MRKLKHLKFRIATMYCEGKSENLFHSIDWNTCDKPRCDRYCATPDDGGPLKSG